MKKNIQIKKGFALIASIMIMSLLLLVAFAMMSLSGTTTRSSTITSGMAEAKANARMALMIAIGELQEQMGPDQRISANGGILDDPNDNTDVIIHPHWTGVWDSWKAGAGEPSQHSTLGSADVMSPTYETNRNDYFRGWLLSLDQGDLNASNNLNVTLPKTLALDGQLNPEVSDTAVRLVGEGSLSDDSSSASDFVNARLIKVSDPEDTTRITGRYGWWVGDESQKARIMYDSYAASPSSLTAADKIFRSQAPGSMGNTSITGLESINGEAQIQKVTSLKTLDLVDLTDPPASDDPKVSQLNFHNSSIYSQGLLADVREGGLKRDLSTLLERPISLTDNGPEFMLYEFDDPRFPDRSNSRVPIQDLAAYYQLYDDEASYGNNRREGVRYNSAGLANAIQLRVPDFDRGLGALNQLNDITVLERQTFLREYTTLYKQPVIAKVQFLVAMTAQPITIADRQQIIDLKANSPVTRIRNNLSHIRDSDTHKLRLGIMPMVTLWNPNNLPLVMDASQILRYSTPPFGFRWRKYREGGEVVDMNWLNLNYAASPSGAGATTGSNSGFCLLRLNFANNATNRIVFEPGEVKVFSLPPTIGATLNNTGSKVHLVSEGTNQVVVNDWDPFGVFLIQNSSPNGAYHNASPNAYRLGTDNQSGEVMVFAPGDRISLSIDTDSPAATAAGDWRDGRMISAQNEIQGVGFNLYMLDSGYQANWRDAIDFMRHYQMGSRNGSGTNLQRSEVAAFNKELITPGFPGGIVPIPPDVSTEAIPGSQIIAAAAANEMVGVLEYSLSQGSEVASSSSGGFGAGRRIASRPFLHSSASAAPFIDQSDKSALYNYGWNWQLGKINTIEDSVVTAKPDTGNGYFGGGYTVENGATHIVQREIPVLPPISIASFSNAHLGGFSLGYANPMGNLPEADKYWFKSSQMVSPSGLDYQRTTATGQGGLAPHVVQAIGNSYAHPNIPADAAFTTWTRLFDINEGQKIVPFVDHSYLANKSLWDEFFFSSISPQPSKVTLFGASTRTAKQVADQFFRINSTLPSKALPNRRIIAHKTNLDQTKLDSLFTEAGTYTDGLADKIAAHLKVDGAFNINSTSVDAWKVFFSSLKGKPVAFLNGGATPQAAETEGTFVGSSSLLNASPIKTADISGPNTPENQWKAGRELTDEEVEELAIAMVKQVKLRGPFLSLSEFVNRRLDDTNLPLALKGALQAALDDEDVSINANFRTPARMLDSETTTITQFKFPDAAKGPIAYGSAPYVDQADVLRHFSEQITARGDTFVIRAYGDAVDANGKIIARAWCEAVVQRMPEYIDSSSATGDQAHTKQAALVSEANRTFGREFQIISFRWLNSEEV